MHLGRYKLLRRVGTGGMAEVWKAVVRGPAGFEKVVAIKRILPHLLGETDSEMFAAEAKLVARLEHPNIVQVFDFGVGDPNATHGPGLTHADYYMAMEYVAGQDLCDLLRRLADRGRRMPIEAALFIAGEVAKALAYAHAETDADGRPLGIVHRDISPQNILVSYRGEVKVVDFGIAKVASAVAQTQSGVWKGKIGYLSPEQANLRPLDHRSDLFGIGLLLYEMVTGRRLFTGDSSDAIFERIAAFQGLEPAALAEIPERVRPIVGRLLQADREARYQDAAAVEADLGRLLGAPVTPFRSLLAGLLEENFGDERRAEGIERAETVERTQISPEGSVEAERTVLSTGPVTWIAAETGTVISGGNAESVTSEGLGPSVDMAAFDEATPAGPEDSEERAWAELVQEHEREHDRQETVIQPVASVGPRGPEPIRAVRCRVDSQGRAQVVPARRSGGEIDGLAVLRPDALMRSLRGIAAPLRPRRRRRTWLAAAAAICAVAAILGIGLRIGVVSERPATAIAVAVPAEPVVERSPGTDATSLADADRPASTPATRRAAPRPESVERPAPSRAADVAPTAPSIAVGDVGRPATARAAGETTPAAAPRTPTESAKARTVTEAAKPGAVRGGWITVLADPWVEVWTGGRQISAGDPLRRLELPAGRHAFQFINARAGFQADRVVEIAADRETKIFVDVERGTVTVDGRNAT